MFFFCRFHYIADWTCWFVDLKLSICWPILWKMLSNMKFFFIYFYNHQNPVQTYRMIKIMKKHLIFVNILGFSSFFTTLLTENVDLLTKRSTHVDQHPGKSWPMWQLSLDIFRTIRTPSKPIEWSKPWKNTIFQHYRVPTVILPR